MRTSRPSNTRAIWDVSATSRLAEMSVSGTRLKPLGTSVGRVLIMIVALGGLLRCTDCPITGWADLTLSWRLAGRRR